ncbi:FAD-dependent oxidoreductase [Breznakiella homolactica]|uniref:FAD-dependent oxidoreductase n=1 Tax=Breznakiella homolactica TaxID=2798577 RepID=A0A7T8B8L7_9SPIR|nr:FAD-dependent oxidoreductase [Breznakiella homolactica]QQO07502.1 FAD-dependent oxidoreductase [Breznakiella homolactica]
MKKIRILAVLAAGLAIAACTSTAEKSGGTETYTGTGTGFNGPIEVSLTMQGNRIKDFEVLSSKDTGFILRRALPVLKERILEANSPVVDSVSGASFTSFGIKAAVADAAKKTGKDFGSVTFMTRGPEEKPVTLKNVSTEVLIVGGGPAGLSAAIEAGRAGAKVIVVEKLDILSGNGKYDRNFFDLADTETQKKYGFEDSADKFYGELMARTSGLDTPERLRVFADWSATTDAWLRQMGVKLEFLLDGKRGHMKGETEYAGEYIQDALEREIAALGIDVRTGTKGTDLIMEDRAAKGVTVQHKNESYSIYADTIIIATGGFAANQELLKRYRPDVADYPTSNQISNTGDFIPVFEKYGIAMANMDRLSIFSYTLIPSRDLSSSTEPGTEMILINTEGKRFVNERSSGIDRAIWAQPEKMAWYVFDEQAKKAGARIRTQIEKGFGVTGNNPAELAAAMKVDQTNLTAALESYNRAARGQGSDPAGRNPASMRQLTPPYYALPVRPVVHMTKGGVMANEKAQVLYENGTVVPNLYAAGEVTNTIDGAYAAAVIFGRVAGTQAAAQVAGK